MVTTYTIGGFIHIIIKNRTPTGVRFFLIINADTY